MTAIKCRICNSNTHYVFSARILNKYEVKYYHCTNCNFLQTEEPYWLTEAYCEPINITDTGLLDRNIYLSKITSVLIYFLFNKNKKYLDYAGGYGVFTRLMRDIGFDFYWKDIYTENLLAKGFEYTDEEVELMTAFEVLEHLVHPLKEIDSMLKVSENILFSTNLLPTPTPQPNEWWYYGLEHGQHISFYSKQTFEYIAKNFNLNYYSYGARIHLLTKKQFNKKILKLLINLNKYGMHIMIKKLMVSKTISDMNYLQA